MTYQSLSIASQQAATALTRAQVRDRNARLYATHRDDDAHRVGAWQCYLHDRDTATVVAVNLARQREQPDARGAVGIERWAMMLRQVMFGALAVRVPVAGWLSAERARAITARHPISLALARQRAPELFGWLLADEIAADIALPLSAEDDDGEVTDSRFL